MFRKIEDPQLGDPQLGDPKLGDLQIEDPNWGSPIGDPQLGDPQLGIPQLRIPQLGIPQLGIFKFPENLKRNTEYSTLARATGHSGRAGKGFLAFFRVIAPYYPYALYKP